MERVQSQLEQGQTPLEQLKIQMKQAERTELRAEQLWLIQQGCGMCAEMEGLLAGYQGIVDEGKSPARKCALLILRTRLGSRSERSDGRIKRCADGGKRKDSGGNRAPEADRRRQNGAFADAENAIAQSSREMFERSVSENRNESACRL